VRDNFYFQVMVNDVIEGKSIAEASRELEVTVLQFRYHFHAELKRRNRDLYKKLLKDKQEAYDTPRVQHRYERIEDTKAWRQVPIVVTPEYTYEFKEIDLPVVREFKNYFLKEPHDTGSQSKKESQEDIR
jgi:hypothetical protein